MCVKCLPIFLFTCFSIFCHALYSQEKEYQFATVDIQQGLSSNQVNCIYKDAHGFMWVGTLSGLNRYDGYGFKIFRHDESDTATLLDDNIVGIFEGPSDKLWIKSQSSFNIYDQRTEKISRKPEYYFQSLGLPSDGFITILRNKDLYYFVYANAGVYEYQEGGRIRHIRESVLEDNSTNPINSAVLDSKGYCWLMRFNGIIEKLDLDQGRNLLRTAIFQKEDIGLQFGYAMVIDSDDDIWLYQRNTLAGVYELSPARNSIRHFSTTTSPALSSNAINGIGEDVHGQIWLVTDHGGVNIIDKDKNAIRHLVNSQVHKKSISDEALNAVYRDNQGIMWLGTSKKGINYFDENSNKFPHYHQSGPDDRRIPFEDINAFVEDKKGNLWIGTNGGGLIYFDRKAGTFTQYRHRNGDAASLTNDVIVALCLDRNDKLWIGTYLGGMDCFDGKTFRHYRHSANDPLSIADDRVFSIYEDSNGSLWIGTLNFGLDRLDREKDIFYHYNPSVPQTLHSPNVTSIMEDSRGNLWVCTAWGVDMLDKRSGRFVHYLTDNSKLSYNTVTGIREDHEGNIWIGTNRGLNVLQKGRNDFKTFYKKDGLADNTVLDILEDDQHFLWVSTKSGISKIEVLHTPENELSIRCINYNEYDGLQGREFNRYAALKLRSGELVFGGANGFNLFNPADVRNHNPQAPLVLTDFQLFNNSMKAGQIFQKHVILPQTITETQSLELCYDENDISLEFAALEFTHTSKTRYAYMLEGFNKDWIVTDGGDRKATYTNLDPGHYTFFVKATNNDGTWNEKGMVKLALTVLPPWWSTSWAYAGYVLLVLFALWLARRGIIRREKMRYALATERKEAQRMRELDMMKIKFFTNVSHEFRTPLSLILVPIEKMIGQVKDAELRDQFQLIQRNAKRLLNMVNQLLDFRKMEVNELKLHTTSGDIVAFIRDVCYAFTDLADKKHIQFQFNSLVKQLIMPFDQDKIERILFNLLSNAFKFTPEEGNVHVTLSQYYQGDDGFLEIKVKDSGIGIPVDKKPRIFDRFFQASLPENVLNQGSGIGLSITREFVEMHGGTIRVDSQQGVGSLFTVLLPIPARRDIPVTAGSVGLNPDLADEEAMEISGVTGRSPGVRSKKPVVLLVEDNDDFRFYLKDNLNAYFTILEASDGKDGWKKALSAHPDLVVSDISMPVMDGVELCRKLKTDPRTKHMPVILLTALEGEQQQLLALETGPNDYLTKPFNFEILYSKMKNLIQNQEAVKQTYQKQVEANPTDIQAEIPEDDFVQKVLGIIETNMSNAEFSVDHLRQELLLSRTSMYKKVLSVTGKTPIEFIRTIRLKRAAQLLEKSTHNVTEVAYMVGFNNPKYFARYFKEEFGILPSLYQSETRKKSTNNPGKSTDG
ncbi:hybrid sensor histidine kinase/response regulator transcription factor [Flavihumibacter petaseus]|uniref:histidine kinase n=1 Tax=Flavihumibacter petaseus NBRC 106054 TaxID=1220578 RepID=A0A0E9N495_9BACT|nr:two-component regulator propeller domain-containing protein [Flavihumibacter petaseus]GAO44649.1 putative two-component hybrid sensor and regulator [Flavihumibacter petaseus NBRC 106054]